MGQVACTLGVRVAQLKQSLVNMLYSVSAVGKNVAWSLTPLKVPAGLGGVVPHRGPVWQSCADGCMEGIVSCEEGGG